MKLHFLSILGVLGLIVGCDRSSPTNAPPSATPKATSPAPAGHGGAVVELGEMTVDGMKIKASRDKGEIKAGRDAPIDVWVMTPDGKPVTVAAVRFWIGTEDAKGSIKAKSEIEDPKEPNHWHTHAEVPDPLQPGAKLWVEVEVKPNEKKTASFDLKL